MDGKIMVPDGLLHLQIGQDELSLDPVETLIEMEAIRERADKKPFAHVIEFQAWLRGKTGKDFSLGLADEIWRAIQLNRASAEKSFMDALQSFDSTESTPAD